jgi:hypothetical protein
MVEFDHAVCLACGSTRPCSIGGNVLVDLTMLLQSKAAAHWMIALRMQTLRNKWGRLATYLFDENGWNGRHERIARQIDPKLSMKLTLQPVGQSDVRMGSIRFDPDYLRWADD